MRYVITRKASVANAPQALHYSQCLTVASVRIRKQVDRRLDIAMKRARPNPPCPDTHIGLNWVLYSESLNTTRAAANPVTLAHTLAMSFPQNNDEERLIWTIPVSCKCIALPIACVNALIQRIAPVCYPQEPVQIVEKISPQRQGVLSAGVSSEFIPVMATVCRGQRLTCLFQAYCAASLGHVHAARQYLSG